jgi:cellulose synthase/poly-beta-1,6-N-acetylglucosamine synthase-like glycosyltransferase
MTFLIIIHVFLILSGLCALFLSFLGVVIRQKAWNFFWRHSEVKSGRCPEASVIVPVRGIDEQLHLTVESLAGQGYPSEFEVIFVADEDPEVYELLKEKCRPHGNFHVYLAQRTGTCSGKNSAVLFGISKSRYGTLAFCDSDEILPEKWLYNLVGSLEEDVGAVSGYRLYIPTNFRSLILAAWNVIGLVHAIRRPFVIGGSYAIRKELLNSMGVPQLWKKTVIDDALLTRQLRKRKKKIRFVPAAVIYSPYSEVFSHIMKFTTRQIVFTKAYFPNIWRWGLVLYGFERLAFFLGVLFLFLFLHTKSQFLLVEPLLFFTPAFFGTLKAFIDGASLRKLGQKITMPAYVLSHFIAQWLMTCNMVGAGFRKTVHWRGRTYSMRNENTSGA